MSTAVGRAMPSGSGWEKSAVTRAGALSCRASKPSRTVSIVFSSWIPTLFSSASSAWPKRCSRSVSRRESSRWFSREGFWSNLRMALLTSRSCNPCRISEASCRDLSRTSLHLWAPAKDSASLPNAPASFISAVAALSHRAATVECAVADAERRRASSTKLSTCVAARLTISFSDSTALLAVPTAICCVRSSTAIFLISLDWRRARASDFPLSAKSAERLSPLIRYRSSTLARDCLASLRLSSAALISSGAMITAFLSCAMWVSSALSFPR
mmetsp:Transcript_25171/g.60096  ORF Transcript_25171/g.60096 Transcript_25171/m.60096 type:complete len:271 (-) Transcript_25171:798-1610(-)